MIGTLIKKGGKWIIRGIWSLAIGVVMAKAKSYAFDKGKQILKKKLRKR